jgi:lipopolysaccharide/colanic/teichoic acid biosynthesis glycosyltransferase
MFYDHLKAAVDRALALGGLAATAPLLGGLAAAVKLTSPGPVLFQSRRLGRGGVTFRMKKLRSLLHGAPEVVTPEAKTFVAANDARLTPLGSFLRRGFDELPQLINVLTGEMSLVGPRPEMEWMASRYTAAIGERLSVRPGITGLAQLCDARRLSTARTYVLDVWYVRHRSLALDLEILLRTIPFLLGRRDVARALLEEALRDPDLPESRFALSTPGREGRSGTGE